MQDSRRNAIITGAASGLGRALAVRLAGDGWRIAVADIDEAGSLETLKLVEAAGGAGHVELLDVARLEHWQSLTARLRKDWSQIDLLVNNAGMGCTGEVGVFPLKEWKLILDVNLYGPIYGCHTMVDWIKANSNGAHIINVASFAAIAPSPSMAAYNVAKAGVVALSETLYAELKPHGVGVTVVCPMFFPTQITAAMHTYDELRTEIIGTRTEQSKYTADDVANAALCAMRRKELYAIPGRQARWYWWLRRIAPAGFIDGIVRDTAKWRTAKAESTNATDDDTVPDGLPQDPADAAK